MKLVSIMLLLILWSISPLSASEIYISEWYGGYTSIEDSLFLRQVAFRDELETPVDELSLPADMSKGKYVFIHTANFDISIDSEKEYYITAIPSDHPFRVFVNEQLVLMHGLPQSKKVNYTFQSQKQLLPRSLLMESGNRIVVEIYPRYLNSGFVTVQINDYETASVKSFRHSFFSYSLLTALATNTFIIAFIFLAFYFASAHHRKDYLYFSIASLAIAGGAFNIIFSFPDFHELTVWKIARISLLFSPVMVLFFEITYNGLERKLRYVRYLLWIVSAGFALSIAIQRDRVVLETIFARSIDIVITPSLVLFTLLALRSCIVRKRLVEYGILLGAIVVILCAFHDIYFYNTQKNPYVWLAVYGYLGLEMSIVGALVYDMVVLFKHRKEQALLIESHNRELKHKNSVIKRMSHEKHELLKNMAHEFKTPLQGILATSELLKKSPESTLRSIDQIMDGLNVQMEKHLFNIENVIDYSIFENDSPEILNGSFDLADFVNSLQLNFKHNEYTQGSVLQISMDPSTPSRFYGAERQLRRIVHGLITNISKTEGSLISLRITWNEMSEHLSFAMGCDRGIYERTIKLLNGFEESDIRVEDASTVDELAVTVAGRLISLIQGKLLITPTCLELSVPVTAIEDQTSDENHDTSVVLVVEDNQVNRLLICKIIERLGYRTIVAENGLKAIEMVLAHRPALVFMDIQMPVMDGIMATRKIRESLPEGDSTVIIALTANASPRECIAAGMDGFLSKPVTIDQVKGILDKHYA